MLKLSTIQILLSRVFSKLFEYCMHHIFYNVCTILLLVDCMQRPNELSDNSKTTATMTCSSSIRTDSALPGVQKRRGV